MCLILKCYRIVEKFGGGFNLAIGGEIAKLNSANIKPYPSRLVTARKLVMHIRTYGSAVPVFQKYSVYSQLKTRHWGFLSPGKNYKPLTRV